MEHTEKVRDLQIYAQNDMSLWATGKQTYWAMRPSWDHDVLVATVEDFAAAAGYTDFGEIGEGDGDETVTLVIAYGR